MKTAELKSILQSGYDRKNWINVLKFITEGNESLTVFLEPRKVELVNKKAKEVVRFLNQLGTLKTPDGDTLPIFEVELQESIRIEYNKVGVNQLIKDFILKEARKGAIATFFYAENRPQEWRFSFISKSAGSEFFDEIEGQETNPKKYTYIFGTPEGHRTAIDRLMTLKSSNLEIDDFFEAFNVEPVSNSFFKEYKRFYVDFVKSLSGQEIVKKEWIQTEEPSDSYESIFNNDPKEVRNFVKRLLGRLVFLYFLQKKRWLGSSNGNYEDGDTNFLQKLYQEAENKDTFYGEWLSKLFFNALNTPDREADQFELPSKQKVWIPFLNGGLFEERQEPENHRTLTFPPYLFEDLFDFFNSYNFTIYENSPEDHTVAVDPEMLGHIFENLLEENSATGAFYTPKEIVQYMTQESLIEYLLTHLPSKERSDIEQLIKNQNRSHFTRNELKTVFEKIDIVKICDPAIGSGAFPMGLLQEIFFLKAFINYEEGFGVDSPAIIKQNIIQNCIYGVDIEPGAVDIARLRFWLSLVVDEPKPKPLPNLDYKIMQGDSLREKFDGIELKNIASDAVIDIANGQTDIWGNLTDGQLKATYGKTNNAKKLQKLTSQYFSASVKEKPRLRNEINEIIHEFIEYNIELREGQLTRLISEIEAQNTRNNRIEKQLSEWKSQLEGLGESRKKLHAVQNTEEHPYFLWRLFFKDVFDQGGFDIVIGNPPYIQLQSLGDYADELADEGYETYTRTGDIYCLFYEKGFDLLKKGGILSYITSNKWMKSGYGKTLRHYFLDNTNIRQLIDFGDAQMFDSATTYTNILVAKRQAQSKGQKVWDLSKKLDRKRTLKQNLERFNDFVPDFNNDVFISATRIDFYIKEKVENLGTPLAKWTDLEINYGIKTGFNDAFILEDADRRSLIAKDSKNEQIIAPILRGRDVKRYKNRFEFSWLINSHNGLRSDNIKPVDVVNDYPSVYKYLEKFGDAIKNRSDQGLHWTNLRNCAYLKEFEKPKIIWLEMSPSPNFTYNEGTLFILNTGYIMTGKSLKYILTVLNSKLMDKYFSFIAPDVRGKTRRYTKQYVDQLPVAIIDQEQEVPFGNLTDYILFLNQLGEKEPINEYVPNKHIVEVFEEVIDAMVLELYFQEDFQRENLGFIEYAIRDFVALEKSDDVKGRKEIIHVAYQKLREDKNEIRNNLKKMGIQMKELVNTINAV